MIVTNDDAERVVIPPTQIAMLDKLQREPGSKRAQPPPIVPVPLTTSAQGVDTSGADRAAAAADDSNNFMDMTSLDVIARSRRTTDDDDNESGSPTTFNTAGAGGTTHRRKRRPRRRLRDFCNVL